jgi:hypothetical protein
MEQLFNRDKDVWCFLITFMTVIAFASFIVIPYQALARVAVIKPILETMWPFAV